MILYHFCPKSALDGIARFGLTLGALPVITPTCSQLIKPVQWLTRNPDPAMQSWAKPHLKENRTEVRIEIDLNGSKDISRLRRAVELLPMMKGETGRIITDYSGYEDWYVYYGCLPPDHIRCATVLTSAGIDIEKIARQGL